jgi:toxin YoeB
MMPKFKEQYKIWMKERPKICKKIDGIIEDISLHFGSGAGFPEKLGGSPNMWSRRISEKHRIVYRVDMRAKLIELLRCRGHYNDNG